MILNIINNFTSREWISQWRVSSGSWHCATARRGVGLSWVPFFLFPVWRCAFWFPYLRRRTPSFWILYLNLAYRISWHWLFGRAGLFQSQSQAPCTFYQREGTISLISSVFPWWARAWASGVLLTEEACVWGLQWRKTSLWCFPSYSVSQCNLSLFGCTARRTSKLLRFLPQLRLTFLKILLSVQLWF